MQQWTEKYVVPSYLVNLRGQAGLYAIVNFIQDIGWLHAVSAEIRLPDHLAWIFTRQKLEMKKWPKWNDVVEITTWIRQPDSPLFCYRDYVISVNGEDYGRCTSVFAVLDRRTRKLSDFDLKQFQNVIHPEKQLQLKPQKVVMPEQDVKSLAQFQVRNSDIDMNDHVNNSKYALWILDSLPIEAIKGGSELKSYEINFLQEAKIGDLIEIQKAEDLSASEAHSKASVFQGYRASDSKAIFRARLEFEGESCGI